MKKITIIFTVITLLIAMFVLVGCPTPGTGGGTKALADTKLYVRGNASFAGNWGALDGTNDMTYVAAAESFVFVTPDLTAGIVYDGFKIADDSWTERTNFGGGQTYANPATATGESAQLVALGVPTPLKWNAHPYWKDIANANPDRISFTTAGAGAYTIIMNIQGFIEHDSVGDNTMDGGAAQLLILEGDQSTFTASPLGTETIYAKGNASFAGNWGAVDGTNDMVYWGFEGTYYTLIVEGLATDTTYDGWKFADAGWTETTNFGGGALADPFIATGENTQTLTLSTATDLKWNAHPWWKGLGNANPDRLSFLTNGSNTDYLITFDLANFIAHDVSTDSTTDDNATVTVAPITF
jgi:hypothetical protein